MNITSHTSTTPLAVVILAAGKGTRMKSLEKPKVMFPVAGKPMIGHVIEQANALSPEKIICITGYLREQVEEFCQKEFGNQVSFALQAEQLGTGHAVSQTAPLLDTFEGNVLILSGDVPLLTPNTLKSFVEFHQNHNSTCSVLSVVAENPFGYGRIIRDANGNFTKITEQKDASPEEALVNEVNSGIYIVSANELFKALSLVQNTNSQGEYYLTDIISILRHQGKTVTAWICPNFDEVQGVNTIEQLTEVESVFLARTIE